MIGCCCSPTARRPPIVVPAIVPVTSVKPTGSVGEREPRVRGCGQQLGRTPGRRRTRRSEVGIGDLEVERGARARPVRQTERAVGRDIERAGRKLPVDRKLAVERALGRQRRAVPAACRPR